MAVVHKSQQRVLKGGALPSLDAEAFTDRFRESSRVLWLIAVGVLSDRQLAEDAVQEAAVIGLRKLGSFEAGTNFTAWMGQIVRHVSLNLRRKHNRRLAVSLDEVGATVAPTALGTFDASRPALDTDGGLTADQYHFDDRLMSALKSIGEVARACLLLRTIEGLDYKEISQLLDIPEGTAMSHVYRTRRALRQRLSDDPATSAGTTEVVS